MKLNDDLRTGTPLFIQPLRRSIILVLLKAAFFLSVTGPKDSRLKLLKNW